MFLHNVNIFLNISVGNKCHLNIRVGSTYHVNTKARVVLWVGPILPSVVVYQI